MAFRGHFEHSLDAKNRLSLPAKFRAAFSDGLVVGKWLDPCIAIFTPEGFDSFTATVIPTLNPLSKERRKLEGFFAHGFFDYELDSAGRITLPATLLKQADIEKEVVIGGTIDRVEVWDRATHAARTDELAAEVNDIAEGLPHPS
ncbi:MAG: division/cell wall cluster transcriptional repressor MraZ [Thermoleophilaceae bacterium]|nr:division/cell wall cluster transcriptional repressor MraZ [Thermoleophilaceae bacterium]